MTTLTGAVVDWAPIGAEPRGLAMCRNESELAMIATTRCVMWASQSKSFLETFDSSGVLVGVRVENWPGSFYRGGAAS
jgi:hypothetical protein